MTNLSVVIMAGGLGKRMQSTIPKVLHMLQHKPMLVHVIERSRQLNPEKIYIIVGKYKNVIEGTLRTYVNMNNIEFVYQHEALGTGHAIQCALPFLCEQNNKILILSGDVPLLTSQTMNNMITESLVSLLAASVDNPTGYGRIVQEENRFIKIVEEKDTSDDEKNIKIINAGVYCFDSQLLCKYLPKLNNNNAQNEYYLTDIFEIILNNENVDVDVVVLPANKTIEITGINTKEQLEELENKLK